MKKYKCTNCGKLYNEEYDFCSNKCKQIYEGTYKNKRSLVMEDFIEYCNEDNPNLANEIKVWLADYFDFRNRVIKVEQYEIDWIKDNLLIETQKIIFGKQIGEQDE